MSKNNQLDQRRVDAVIRAYLEQNSELLPKIKEMAERFREPVDALARFLCYDWLGDADLYDGDVFVNESDYPDLPCTRKQFTYFLSRAKIVAREESRRSYAYEGMRKPEVFSRFARVGQWHTNLEDCQQATESEEDVEWIPAWIGTITPPAVVGSPAEKFINHGLPPSWRPANAYRNFGFVRVLSGLYAAIRYGFVTVPEERKFQFLLDYARWFGDVRCGYCPSTVADTLFGSACRRDWTNQQLQHFAVYDDLSSSILGDRGVPLLLPLVQCTRWWIESVMRHVPTGTIKADAKKFNKSSSVFERRALWEKHMGALVKNPEDPFGPEVRQFDLLTGNTKEPPFPTYEEALEYLKKHLVAK